MVTIHPKKHKLNYIGWQETDIGAPYTHDLYFGRSPFKVLTTFRDKLLYAYANAPVKRRMNKQGRVYYYHNYTKITNTVKKLLPEFNGVRWEGNSRPDCDDHPLFGWLKMWNMSLEEYLMNKNVIVICDGDEYCIWESLKERGITNGCIAKELPVS